MQNHGIWLIDRSKLFREGLKMLFAGSPFQITWEVAHMSAVHTASGDEAPNPAVILIALHSSLEPGTEDLAELTRICQLLPRAAVVVLSDAMSVSQCTAAMRAGARGYLLRDITPEGLTHSLSLVLVGEKVLPTDLVGILVDGPAREDHTRGEAANTDEPSAREKLILQCLANGYPNKAIAIRLNITEATVKVHIKTVFRKIRVRNRTEAAIWALSNGYHSGMEPVPFRSAHRRSVPEREVLGRGEIET